MSLDIAIIGAGIGGLAAAIMCARDGHHVTLFERFSQPRPLGSGLVIQPVGLAVLDRIGVGDAAREISSPIVRMFGRDRRDGRMALDVSYPTDKPGRAFHRTSLFTILWQAAQSAGITTVTDTRVTATQLQCDKRIVLTPDGDSKGPFDLIVDASGAGSVLSPLQAKPLGFGALWASVPWPDDSDLARNMLHQQYDRAYRMAGILPIGHMPDDPTPMAAVFWSLPTTDLPDWPDAAIEDWRATVCDHWPRMQPFVRDLPKQALTAAVYSHGTLRRPYSTALVHIGDAAHRASPQLGQGANMALLDALALSLALHKPLDDALPDYADMRRWHLRGYQGMSRFLTPMYQSHSRALPWLRNRVLAPASRLPVVRHGLRHMVTGSLIPPLAGERLAPASLHLQGESYAATAL